MTDEPEEPAVPSGTDGRKRSGQPGGGGGYCDPPHHSRFSSEHQPARRGRKRGARGVKTELLEFMNTPVPVKRPDGRPAKELPLAVLLRAQFRSGVTGNVRAVAHLLELVTRVCGIEDPVPVAARRLPRDDALILANFARRVAAELEAEEPDPAETALTVLDVVVETDDD